MTDFTITEDFPRSDIVFDERLSDPKACYDYLFKQKWPNGFTCRKCGHYKYWVSARNLYIGTKCEHHHSLIASTIMDSSKNPISCWFKAMGDHYIKIRDQYTLAERDKDFWSLRN